MARESWLDNTTAKDAVTSFAGTELFRVVQSGVSKKVTYTVLAAAIAGALTAGLTIGSTTITGGINTRILYNNAGALGEYTISGSGTAVAMAASPVLTSPTLGVATATSINGLTITSSTGTFTLTDGKVFSVLKTLSLDGTDSTTMTFPTTSASIARTDAGQTFTGASTTTSWIMNTVDARGTWTAGATWTLPAITLGGTVSGGGQQLNNIIIGTSTPLAGSFTSLNASGVVTGTVNGALSAPGLTFTGTWITGGDATTTKPYWLIQPTGTTSTGWSTSGTGLGVNAASGFTGFLWDAQVAGVTKGYLNASGTLRLAQGIELTGSSGTNIDFTIAGVALASTGVLGWRNDLYLVRDAANTLAQRNGTTAQVFRIYNTYANSGTDYERFDINWSSNDCLVGTFAGGTGTGRQLHIKSASTIRFYTSATTFGWSMDVSGHFIAGTDNTYDIGASGATRPRTIYAGTSVITPLLRIDQTPTAVSQAVDTTINSGADGAGNIGHRISINANGTTYWIPCSTTAF